MKLLQQGCSPSALGAVLRRLQISFVSQIYLAREMGQHNYDGAYTSFFLEDWNLVVQPDSVKPLLPQPEAPGVCPTSLLHGELLNRIRLKEFATSYQHHDTSLTLQAQ